MEKAMKALGGLAIVLSMLALLAAFLGGTLLTAISGLLRAFTMGKVSPSGYPLGAYVFILYLIGIGLGVVAPGKPVVAGSIMLPLGVIAIVFGGPVAQGYGVAIICVGLLLLVLGLRKKSLASPVRP